MITRRHVLSAAGAAAAVAGFGGAYAARPAVGLSLPLTGVQAQVADELRQGYEAALAGVAELDVVDDESKPEKTLQNVEAFVGKGQIIATTGIVGTPHAKAAIPSAVAGQLPMVGIRSGAAELRDGNSYVFHLRASFEDEITKVINTAGVFGAMGILYSDDDFGRARIAHARAVAASKGVKIAVALPVDRNGSNVKEQTNTLATTPGLASVLLCLIQTPALAAAKELRTKHHLLMLPIFGMSFIATSSFATLDDPTYDGMSLVMPFGLARASTVLMARSFREKVTASNKEHLIESPAAFEGYFYGSVLGVAITRGGATRKGLQSFLLQQRPFEVQEVPIAFDERRVGYNALIFARKAGKMLRAS